MISQLLPKDGKVHFVGILGIGMSALAQLFNKLGYEVTGSDRNYQSIDYQRLVDCLIAQRINLFPQDGVGIDEKTKLIIYSTAIEQDNVELIKGKNVPQMHRAYAMKLAMETLNVPQIAISGSSGKTSVTALVATALKSLGKDVLMINGGCVKNFISEDNYGNFIFGKDIIVYEADESDSSLVNYRPDYAILLNISNDHYSIESLKDIFTKFLSKVKKKCFLPDTLKELSSNGVVFEKALDYSHKKNGVTFATKKQEYKINQLGAHSVKNALAVITILKYLGYQENQNMLKALNSLLGVERRLEYKGETVNACPVYDDYAHNVAKIQNSIKTMQKIADNLVVVFQPHGYSPLKFMREELGDMLQKELKMSTKFYFLPVFYVGGTTSFSPKSEEVVKSYQLKNINVEFLTRKQFECKIAKIKKSIILILGARDASLGKWCEKLVL